MHWKIVAVSLGTYVEPDPPAPSEDVDHHRPWYLHFILHACTRERVLPDVQKHLLDWENWVILPC